MIDTKIDLKTFRSEVNSWVVENYPESLRNPVTSHNDVYWGGRNQDDVDKDLLQWFSACYEKGWVVPHWEKKYGGGGLTLKAIKRGHDMGREFKVLTGLNRGFKKAPKVYAYTEDKTILGVPFYIMQKVEGIIIDLKEAKRRKISNAEFPTIADTWLDTLVELHALKYKAIGLGDLGRPAGYVERQVRNWSKQYIKAKTENIPEASKVMVWLDEHQPTEYHHCLIHNDYKYDNVLYEDNSWRNINAVLDWEMCTLGDPFMDLGAAIAYWITADDDPMIRQTFPYPTIMEGNPSRMEVVEKYAQKSGRPVNHLVFYYAFGLFKNAVIVQQIYYRYAKGLTSNERFASLNQVTKLFMQFAWKAIQRQRIE